MATFNEADLPAFGEFSRGLREARGLSGGFAAELGAATAELRAMDAETRRLSRSLGSGLREAFDKAVFGGAKLGDVMRGLASDIIGSTLDAALRPVQGAVSSGIAGAIGSLSGGIGSLFGFAQGGAFSAGRVRAFAQGGVVDGPTLFPMRGATGLMGEAGPEAILPLSRGADGRLGVAAAGARGAPQITVNIQTPDVEGFRRSRAQVSAQLARAVARGERQM
ncbi:phage tail tape measure protein [Limibaculum sp. FT325]|uniref:phage tail tape measure protein n=1 Tax=Thermohalobaculum sediminis TaxID=2939436 RepID=UPI0020C103F3|nr:phage tail tape measure protein [Limibaculum sediminis]MCL5775583.1 phage tail tape measure protein [Limibaculum sediminis]